MGELIERVLQSLFELPSLTVYLLILLLCWAEAAFFLGFVTPGELAVAIGGILASRGQLEMGILAGVVITGTLVGNGTGFYLGRRWGTGMLEWAPLRRMFGPSIDRAQDFMLRRGEWAIVLGRLATPTRIVVPFLAGASAVPYRRFVLFDVPATIVWALVWTTLGFVLGESWELLEDVAGTAALLLLILFVLAVTIRWVAARIAANQRRVQVLFLWSLRVTGTRGIARVLAPGFRWLGRRLDPRLAQGLSLTISFVALIGAIGAIGLVMSQTQAVRGLALIDFPVLEWMSDTRTDDAVAVARTGLLAFHWPGIFILAVPLMSLVAWKVGWVAALRMGVGLVGAAGGAYFLDRFVIEGLVPRAEYPSVPVAVAAVLLVHTTALAARVLGWGPSVGTAGVGTFVLCTVALGTVVAGWAAPSGIALGLALGLAWATALELPWTVFRSEREKSGGQGTRSDPN
ncbi:MAG: DedA family protein [Gemmatimonadales bacterium]|nr:MAG: DedA family protein [Gemmatimonadales bacterium]